LKGFVTLLNHFASRDDGSHALKRFWPMARDLLLSVPYFRMSGCPDSVWFDLYDGCRQALGPPRFAQCLAYRDDDWAIRDHLHYHARILSRAFFASVAPQTDDPIDTINTAIENIRDDLQAIEEYIAQHYSATVEQFINISDLMLSQCSLATVLEYQVCKLYLTLLDTPDGNLLEGMQKADTIKEALRLVQMLSKVAKFCQQVEGRWALNFSDVCDQMFMFVLVLAALALPREVVLHLHVANGTPLVEFSNIHSVHVTRVLAYFFGEHILIAMDNYYEVPNLSNLRGVVDYWFTFRTAAENAEAHHEPSSCPGCARKAEFQVEVVNVTS
jgi:hypothetical protein